MRHALVPSATFATRKAFSLVEVVIALGVVSFCLFALLGLLSVGAQASHDSAEVVQATTMASVLLSEIRAAPTTNFGANCPILPLTNTTPQTNTFLVAPDCTLLTGAQTGVPGYKLTYIRTPNIGNSAALYFCLSWPSSADLTNATGRYEIFTCLPLQ